MSNYRIVRLSSIYYKRANQAFSQEVAHMSYQELRKYFAKSGFVHSDSFARGMRLLGHDAEEIAVDSEIMQKAWAREHGVSYTESNWKVEIALKQLEILKPTVVHFQHAYALPFEIQKELKTRIPSIKLLTLFNSIPFFDDEVQNIGNFDLIFCGTPFLLRYCHSKNLPAHLVYHGFDENLLEADVRAADVDFSFVGSSGFGYPDHIQRYWLLFKLMHKTPLRAWVDENNFTDDEDQSAATTVRRIKLAIRDSVVSGLSALPESPLMRVNEQLGGTRVAGRLSKRALNLKRQRARLRYLRSRFDVKEHLPADPLSTVFPERCHPSVFGREMYRLLARTKLSLNKHLDLPAPEVGNMRLFEITGVGSCMLVDHGSNLADLFKPDEEVVTYSNPEECIEKARFLLSNPQKMKQIAKAGQQRTLRDHTIASRCSQIDALIQKELMA